MVWCVHRECREEYLLNCYAEEHLSQTYHLLNKYTVFAILYNIKIININKENPSLMKQLRKKKVLDCAVEFSARQTNN